MTMAATKNKEIIHDSFSRNWIFKLM